ncbi:hypothetical protein [Halomonas sp. AOP25-F1-15]|uniref:hypothetical protein n=1 Tax=Halomonas sp. AOP25-F1-15 TaxID=3457709 RepID=UPI004033C7A0
MSKQNLRRGVNEPFPIETTDPTDGTVLAWSRDYADVAPLKGVMNGSGEHCLEVNIDVLPIAD